MRGRCAIDDRVVYNSAVVCKQHVDEWLHRYKPTKCAACPRSLSSSAWRPCPEWLREQLAAQHGAFVHERPCYREAVAAKQRQAADPQPIKCGCHSISRCQSLSLPSLPMHVNRSILAPASKLTRSVALLGGTSSAQTAAASLQAVAMKWLGAVFLTCPVLLLRRVAASSLFPLACKPSAHTFC